MAENPVKKPVGKVVEKPFNPMKKETVKKSYASENPMNRKGKGMKPSSGGGKKGY